MENQTRPLVTVVVPIYNHEKYVVEAIESIIRQTYQNIELIVINDGSRDKSHERVLPLIETCKSRFVRFEYINRGNVGLSATLNQALAMAKGAYFSVLASDDVALPEKIEVLINELEGRDEIYAAAFGDALFVDDEGYKLAQNEDESFSRTLSESSQAKFLDVRSRISNVNYRSDLFGRYETLLKRNHLPAMANLTRTKYIVEVHGWTEGNLLEDWEMWLKLARKYKFARIDRPLALYRWHATNTVKTARTAIDVASFRLVSNERPFCNTPELLRIWKDSRRTIARRLVRNRSLSIWERLRLCKATGPLNWSKVPVKWLLRK